MWLLPLWAIAGALLRRAVGSGDFSQTLTRLALVVLPTLAATRKGWWYALPIAVLSYLGLITAHGRYYVLGRTAHRPDRADTWAALPSKWLGLARETWLFDAVALAVTGLVFTLPLAILALSSGHLWTALILVLSGLSKPLSYEAGWRSGYKDPITVAELLNGGVNGLAFGLAFNIL